MIDRSLAHLAHPSTDKETREQRGIWLWYEHGHKIRPMPSGGLSIPSGDGDRSYRVQLVEPARCGCLDFQRRREVCKHILAGLIWEAKQRSSNPR
jgi:hypothetical protein